MKQLSGNKAAWATASLDQRITILKEIKARLTDKVGGAPWGFNPHVGPAGTATTAATTAADL